MGGRGGGFAELMTTEVCTVNPTGGVVGLGVVGLGLMGVGDGKGDGMGVGKGVGTEVSTTLTDWAGAAVSSTLKLS